jgi:hypothetical protein
VSGSRRGVLPRKAFYNNKLGHDETPEPALASNDVNIVNTVQPNTVQKPAT